MHAVALADGLLSPPVITRLDQGLDPVRTCSGKSPSSVEECTLTPGTPVIDVLNHDLLMSALSVPIEIVLRILDLAYASSLDLKLLQSCSLVCRAWSAHAQKMLFRSVSISTQCEYASLVFAFQLHTPRSSTSVVTVPEPQLTKQPPLSLITSAQNFLPTLGSVHSNVLRGSVIELNVIIDLNQPNGLSFENLSHVVSSCPNLRKIGISVFGTQPRGTGAEGTADPWRMRRLAPPLPDEVVEELRTAPNASKVSELRLHDWSDSPVTLTRLLSVWPRITSLKIAGKLPIVNYGIDAAPCALKKLSLNCATGTEASVDFVKWLLSGSHQTLQHLAFLKEPSAKLLEDILTRPTFPLDSVSLPSCSCPVVGQIIQNRLGPSCPPSFDDSSGTGETNTLAKVQGLKEVFVEDPSTPFKLLGSIIRSGTIQRLGFGVDGRTDLSSLARAIKAQTGMKHIAVWLCNNGERNFGLGSLRVACAMKGIELEETRDIREFRGWNP